MLSCLPLLVVSQSKPTVLLHSRGKRLTLLTLPRGLKRTRAMWCDGWPDTGQPTYALFLSRSILRTLWIALSAVVVGMSPPPILSIRRRSRRTTSTEVPPDVVRTNVSASFSCSVPALSKAFLRAPVSPFAGRSPLWRVFVLDCVDTDTTSL